MDVLISNSMKVSANKTFFYNPFDLDYHTLTIAKDGTGAGTVTSSPAGVNCASFCTDTFVAGLPVELIATPTLGSFTGWSGACSGTGPCTVTMDAAKSVTATFTFTPPIGVEFVAGPNRLQWSPVPGAVGYEVCYGTSSGVYTTCTDVGNVTFYTPSLPSGTYYFAVKAYDAAHHYTSYSSEVMLVNTDTDGDGIPDQFDNCPLTPNGPLLGTCFKGKNTCTSNADCTAITGDSCSKNQEDTDLDGVGDVCDNCPNDFNPFQTDMDNDGVGDVCDNCPSVANGPLAGTCIKGQTPCTSNTQCTAVADDTCSMNQEDTDGDGIGDVCEAITVRPGEESTQGATLKDTDGDGINDTDDNCPSIPNPKVAGIQPDTDGDGIGDACDRCPNDRDNDIDGDGICAWTLAGPPPDGSLGDTVDNCPYIYNPKVASWVDKDGFTHTNSQPDYDLDGIGDACDTDADNDGIPDKQCAVAGQNPCTRYIPISPPSGDNCPLAYNPDQKDTDGDGRGDACDPPQTYDIVFKMPVGLDYNTWLPTDGAQVTVTGVARENGADNSSIQITFSPVSVTNYPGKYTNDPSTDTSNDFDYTFDLPNRTINLICRDYGGSITIRATATIGGQNVQRDFTLPKDTDGDGLPDYWENLYGDLIRDEDRLDRSAENILEGDGLTNFQEYRGFKWGELKRIDPEPLDPSNPYKTTAYVFDNVRHFRTSPLRKDLFVKYTNFTTDNTADYYKNTDYPFAIGAAFFEAGIDVHAVSSTDYTNNGLGSNNIHVLNINHETAKSYGSGSSTADSYAYIARQKDKNNQIIPRGWKWATKGYSLPGSGTLYGSPIIYQKALNFYFTNRPYTDGQTWNGTSWVAKNNRLDPLNLVEDKNDNGSFNTGEDFSAGTASILDGDFCNTSFSINRDLSPFDINNNSEVELPVASDPNSIDSDFQYKKKHVLKHTITHEMGHAVGVPTSHTADSSCAMYQYSNNWSRDWKFGTTAKGCIKIHNHN
jgi:hypothetical protein